MPQFAPSEVKTARAPITVKPSGLSCSTELYLVSNGAKVATSGVKIFTSTGAKQDISLPITMLGAEGTYPIYLDIFTNGLLVGAYKATEDVVIVAPALPTYILVCRYMDIIDVDRIPFTEVSDRRAVMREPMRCSAGATHFSFTLYWRLNTEMFFSIDGPRGIRFIGGFAHTRPDGSVISGSSYVSGTWRCPIPYVQIRGIFEARTGITYSWSDEAIGRFLPSGVPLTLMLNAKDPETMSSSYSGGNFYIENALVLT